MKITYTKSIHVDLASIRVTEWPEDAKRIARGILQTNLRHRKFLALPLEARKPWLIERVEAQAQFEEELSDWLGTDI